MGNKTILFFSNVENKYMCENVTAVPHKKKTLHAETMFWQQYHIYNTKGEKYESLIAPV